MALLLGHRLSPRWPHTPTKTAASIAPPFSHLADHTIAFSGQWDGLGFHGDRTNKETSCQECFSFCPRSSSLKLQPPPPGLCAAYSSTSARSGFRHHVRHTNLLYLRVCVCVCVSVCVYVCFCVTGIHKGDNVLTTGLNLPGRWREVAAALRSLVLKWFVDWQRNN